MTSKNARRLAWAAGIGLSVATVSTALWMPEQFLQAEFARLRWLAGAEVQSKTIADHQWVYLKAGFNDENSSEKPLIFLVHGYTGSKENWLQLTRELSKKYRVIAPDLPGWGETTRLADGDYGVVLQSQRLAAFIQSFDETPNILIGHSMGGHIAGLVASRQPELVSKLVLMSAAGVEFKQNEFARSVLEGGNPFEVKTREQFRAQMNLVFSDAPPFVPWPFDEAMVQRRRKDASFEAKVLDSIGRGPDVVTLQSELQKIQSPTLLLWCENDRVIDVSSVPIFQAGIANSQALILKGCGHMPMMAKPVEVAQGIENFLAVSHSPE
jgi:abhydrolase domain-containing protein 6